MANVSLGENSQSMSSYFACGCVDLVTHISVMFKTQGSLPPISFLATDPFREISLPGAVSAYLKVSVTGSLVKTSSWTKLIIIMLKHIRSPHLSKKGWREMMII